MKIVLAFVSLIGTATVISSLPWIEDSIYKELAKLDDSNDEKYHTNNWRSYISREQEKARSLVQLPLSSGTSMKKQDVSDFYHELAGISSKILSSIGNLLYKIFDKKYGIDDEFHKVMREMANIFYIAASLNNADSYRVDSEVKEGVQKASRIAERILSYLYGRFIRKGTFDISDCKPASAVVDAPDGWAPPFQVLKYYQQNFTCLFFKKAERDNSLTTVEIDMFKTFFDLVIKLYETEYLTADVDKTNLKKSLDYFLEQVNKLNFSQTYKNDVKTLTNIFFKVLTGELLTLTDKAFALKSFLNIYIAQLRGMYVFRNLLYNHKTAAFLRSLAPIAMKIGLREYIRNLKQRKHIDLSSNTRMILNQLLPMLKNFRNTTLQYLLKFDGILPKYFPDMQFKRRAATEQKVSEHNNGVAFVMQQRPDLVTAAALLKLMLTDEYAIRVRGQKFVKEWV